MKRTSIILVGALILLAGCFDIEMGMKLEKNLSGTFGMSTTIDMEPMLLTMASFQRQFSGEEGPPTDAELAEMRAEMMAEMNAEEELTGEELRNEVEADLPEGFELISAESERDGLATSFNVLVSFPHIDRLKELELNQPGDEPTGGAAGEMDFDSISNPFQGLELIDEGDTYLLVSDVPNPVEDLGEQENMMFDMEEMFDNLFGNLRVAFTIEVPGEIVEHNATRVEGDKLIWEFTPDNLKDGVGTDIDQIRVRFKK
ncbi:hypothetical protein ACFL3H_08805 [Gemmatimonadota bacterium]